LPFRRRVAHPFFAARLRSPLLSLWPPLRSGALFSARPRPEPDFLPPWLIAFSVAHARGAAARAGPPPDS
jgi:hypothetical protein